MIINYVTFDAANEIYRSYIIRNIAPDFPVCMFIPIIASRHVALPYVAYPPKATAIWIKAVAAGTCRPARGAILLAGRTDGRTYEISLPSCIYPDRVQHPSLFSLAAKTKGWSDQNSKQKTKFIATDSNPRFIQSRIASAKIGSDLISYARPRRESSISCNWWYDFVSGWSLSSLAPSVNSDWRISRPLSVGKQNYEVWEYFSSTRDNVLSTTLSWWSC